MKQLNDLKKSKRLSRWDEAHKQPGCLICQQPWGLTKKTQPHYDHCHKTGKFRGYLCATCNTGLGMFKDNPTLLRKAALYLELVG